MARTFVRGSLQDLRTASTPVTAAPLTMTCWFKALDVLSFETLFSIADSGTLANYFRIVLAGSVAGDFIRADARAGGAASSAITTAGYTAGTWHHVCAVYVNDTVRYAFLDGANKGTSSFSRIPAGLDRIGIGANLNSAPGGHYSGDIAEAAIWNAALTDREVAELAVRARPSSIRPASLVFYPRLIRDEDQDLAAGLTITATNTPTIGTHAPIIDFPAPSFSPALPAASVIRWKKHGGLHLQTDANWGVALNHYFQADLRATKGTMWARLIKVSDGAEVANSVISTASATQVRVRSAALTLVDTETYAAQTGWIPGTDEGFGQTARIVHF